jgi:hypothetical protein
LKHILKKSTKVETKIVITLSNIMNWNFTGEYEKEDEMFNVGPEMLAVLIPISAVIGTIAIIITAIILGMREKELKHKETILAMEKGIELPKEPEKRKRPRYFTIRMWGFIFAFIGIGVVLGIWGAAGIMHGVWGLVPTFLGLALLLSAHLEKKELAE